MKAMKTFAALLALAFSLAGCGAVDGSPVRPAPSSAGQGSSTAASGADSAEPEQLAAMRQLAGENGDLAGVLYLGSVPERTTDVHAVLDSLPEQPWQFVADIPADRWVAAPGVGCWEKSSTPSTGTGRPVEAESCGFQSSERPVLQ